MDWKNSAHFHSNRSFRSESEHAWPLRNPPALGGSRRAFARVIPLAPERFL